MPTKRELLGTLKELGKSAEDIVRKLEAESVYGRHNSSIECPVARWVARQYPQYRVTISMERCILSHRGDSGPDMLFVTAFVPPAMRNFIRRFDVGEYPQLEYPDKVNDDDY